MNRMILVTVFLLAATVLPAQSNGPVKLALISETDEAAPVADLLTAKLSADPQVQLLERDEIDKVYREQGLSAANTDYLKLGRLLGADGLVLLDLVKTGTATNLTARLIAVKPGVVLTEDNYSWPLKDLSEWAGFYGGHLDSFLPKLTLSAGEAIPISVVNFRSAISSGEARETEQQLKLLAIQRLSRERQFFVLERQKLDLLGEEKALSADETAFWDGSYLLEGLVDKNGYSPDTMTIDARLTPAKGGAPLLFHVSGSRTNEAGVLNELVLKVGMSLKLNPMAPTWDAADEARRYYDEGQWALRWGSYAEAETAADSAWALGKRDMDCATLRVRAYMITPDTGKPVIQYPFNGKPDPQTIALGRRALQIYFEYSRGLPADEPKVDSSWYQLGLQNLVSASRTLQIFHEKPEYYGPAAGPLAELRAAARSVADQISQLPSVHDSYFIGDRIAVYDELDHFEEQSSIFSVELDCGCLWQDRPEDALGLYRRLMSSPVFRYFHDRLWYRDEYHNGALGFLPPRLVAWNETDERRLPAVWHAFMRELDDSSNPLWQLEARAICLADATNDVETAVAFTNFFNTIVSDQAILITNRAEVLYLDWGVGDLIERLEGGRGTPVCDALQQLYSSEYRPKLEEMDQEYREQAAAAIHTAQFALTFEKQKEYLKTKKGLDFSGFWNLFEFRGYSRAEALELRPLVAAYEADLAAQSHNVSPVLKAVLSGEMAQVDFLKNDIDRILDPPAPVPARVLAVPKANAPANPVIEPVATVTNSPLPAANPIAVNEFLPIPLDGLAGDKPYNVKVTAHHWFEGRLLLDFEYDAYIYYFDKKGNWTETLGATFPAIALLDPVRKHWDVIGLPWWDIDSQGMLNGFYHRSVLLNGDLFTSDRGQIKKYDWPAGKWQALGVSDSNDYELFAVNGHLYAANGNIIFEILDGGKSTRILASTRRQPPVTVLDTQNLGTPILFAGPDHSLRVSAAGKIFSWTGSDWHEDFAAPPAAFPPEVFPGGVLFRQSDWNQSLSLAFVSTEASSSELCFWQKKRAPGGEYFDPTESDISPPPLWQMPDGWFFTDLPAAMDGSNLYLLADHATVVSDTVPKKVVSRDGYQSVLLCFSHGFAEPQKVPLTFDAVDGWPPLAGLAPTKPPVFSQMPATWMTYGSGYLFFGEERPRDAIPIGDSWPGQEVYRTGVWLLACGRIKPAITMQRQAEIAQLAADHDRFLAKYDLNHNGVIDPDEKEAALDDPAFIESQLDLIDTNHNGRIDLAELAYFDANHDKILEPKEQAGINLVQQLLARKDLQTSDATGTGQLDRSEFDRMCRAGFGTGPGDRFAFDHFDTNHDGKIDAGELANYLTQWTRKQACPRQTGSMEIVPQFFKRKLEAYWSDPRSLNQPLHSHLDPERLREFMLTNGVTPNFTP